MSQGGPSNRELLQKLQRVSAQLQVIDERLLALERHANGGMGSDRGVGGAGGGGGSGGLDGSSSSVKPNGGATEATFVEPING